MIEQFAERVSTKQGFDHELHVIKVKMAVGVLEKPEDSYMWPYLLAVWDKFNGDENDTRMGA